MNESDKQSKKQKLRSSRRCLTVGTWNVRILVESMGDERICRKAGGKSGILPELILCGGAKLWSRILKLMQQVWEEGRVVGEWQDAVVVLVPKKGYLRHCDNW